MIHERQQEQASLYVLGTLTSDELESFERELGASAELRELVLGLQRAAGLLALTLRQVEPPRQLREKVLQRVRAERSSARPNAAVAVAAGLRFHDASDTTGWKPLPVRGAWVKLLSLERDRGYAVLLGRLEPGVRYPAHVNVGAEDLCVLTGDLFIGERRLGPGDFHHADDGSYHDVNYSVGGCTLIAVLTADHPLVMAAMA